MDTSESHVGFGRSDNGRADVHEIAGQTRAVLPAALPEVTS
jgi:hypothetical protein